MNAIAQISRRSLDELAADIISLSGHINDYDHVRLAMLRVSYLRQAWKPYHFNHCSNGSRCCG